MGGIGESTTRRKVAQSTARCYAVGWPKLFCILNSHMSFLFTKIFLGFLQKPRPSNFRPSIDDSPVLSLGLLPLGKMPLGVLYFCQAPFFELGHELEVSSQALVLLEEHL